MSILLLYKRTFTIKSMRYAIYIVGAFVLAIAVSNCLALAFQCTPPAKFWNHERPGHCVNQPVLITIASMFPMLTDFIIYIMPMPVIWRLKLTLRRKFELSFVFAIGGFVCLTGIVRLIDTIIIRPKDLTWTNVGPIIWNLVESEIGFVVGNMLSMGSLIGRIRTQAPKPRHPYLKQEAQSNSAASKRSALKRRRSMDGSGLVNFDVRGGGFQTVTVGRSDDNSSAEEAFPMDAIIVRTNVEQKSEEVSLVCERGPLT
ncbi:hypothetical protein MMC29_000350 [Sticta canariensis]|nr:hypothetical protein [Sticta canariensis]